MLCLCTSDPYTFGGPFIGLLLAFKLRSVVYTAYALRFVETVAGAARCLYSNIIVLLWLNKH